MYFFFWERFSHECLSHNSPSANSNERIAIVFFCCWAIFFLNYFNGFCCLFFAFFAIHKDEFRSKLACENDNMPLMCNPYSRIAIYSASFGHTERETVQCGGPGTPPGTVRINREENSQPSKQQPQKPYIGSLIHIYFIASLPCVLCHRDCHANLSWTATLLGGRRRRHLRTSLQGRCAHVSESRLHMQ